MSCISITPNEVRFFCGEQNNAYTIKQGKVTVNSEEVATMPNPVRLALVLLVWGKQLRFGDHYNAMREPVNHCYSKATGLSPQGLAEYGQDPTVAEAIALCSQTPEPTQQPTPTREVPPEGTETEHVDIVESAGVNDAFWDSSSPAQVEMVDVARLYENPLNATLYERRIDEGLAMSVETHGVLVPVRALRSGKLIDGWQRLMAARNAGFKKIPVIFCEISEHDELEWMLLYNRQRIKDTIERVREFRAYLQIEAKKAKERAGRRTDKNPGLPDRHAVFGKARDIAAKNVGLSGSSADRGLRVVESLEKHGESQSCEEVRRALLESINAGYKAALRYGLIDSAHKPKHPKAKKTEIEDSGNAETDISAIDNGESTSAATADDDDADSQESKTDTNGWITDELITETATASAGMLDDTGELEKTLRLLRPRIYMLAGRQPSPGHSDRLRAIANAIAALADKYDELTK